MLKKFKILYVFALIVAALPAMDNSAVLEPVKAALNQFTVPANTTEAKPANFDASLQALQTVAAQTPANFPVLKRNLGVLASLGASFYTSTITNNQLQKAASLLSQTKNLAQFLMGESFQNPRKTRFNSNANAAAPQARAFTAQAQPFASNRASQATRKSTLLTAQSALENLTNAQPAGIAQAAQGLKDAAANLPNGYPIIKENLIKLATLVEQRGMNNPASADEKKLIERTQELLTLRMKELPAPAVPPREDSAPQPAADSTSDQTIPEGTPVPGQEGMVFK